MCGEYLCGTWTKTDPIKVNTYLLKVGKVTTDAIENSVLARIPILLFPKPLKIISFALYEMEITS